MLENPASSSLANPRALYENQGLTAMSTWAHFGTAAVATALGLVVADFVDRIVATRQPADSGSTKATMPWYGRDAAAAQRMRPDAWRLGAQAAGAVIALGLAFWTRSIKFLPWAFGGIALGFGSNLIMKLTTWWLMPALLKVKDPSEASLANRTYVLEQDAVQSKVADMFAKWDTTPSLNTQQTTPLDASGKSAGILSPLGAGNVYALGKGQGNGAAAHGAVGAQSAHVVKTNRLGLCPFCKQVNGCLSNCPSLCPNCPEYRPFIKAAYPVKAGDNLTQLAALGGVRIEDVNALNGGTPETYWQPGKKAMVPYGIAMVLEQRQSSGSVGTPPAEPKPETPVATPAPTPAPVPEPEVVAQSKSSFSVQNLGLQTESENIAE